MPKTRFNQLADEAYKRIATYRRIDYSKRFVMNVTVHERDNQNLSREARAMGMVVWDVIQNGELAGIFPSRDAADAYRKELETSKQQG